MKPKNVTSVGKKFIATTDLSELSIGIVGGGIGGLTAALAFAERGASVFVYEQAAEFSEVGAGVQITPNAGRVLDAFGILDDLSQVAVTSEAVVPVDGLTAKAITVFDLRAQTPRYLFVHRAKLIALLVETCRERGVQMRNGVKAVDASPNGALCYVVGDTAPHQAQHDLIVFADGIHSIGRTLINGRSEPFFTGQVAWRAIVPGTGPKSAQIAMGPGRHVVIYPLSETELNIVAVQERNDWAAEGWNVPDNPENLQAAFAEFAPTIRDVLARVDHTNLWGLFRHEVAERWYSENIVLLGDAAHPTLPFLAQGANLAIEDGYVLARMISEDGIADGLSRYQGQRRARVQRAIKAANANAQNYHLSGARRIASHMALKAIGRLAPNAFIRRLSWLYDRDVTR